MASWPWAGYAAGDLPWTYDENEACFILAGKVTVEIQGRSMEFAAISDGEEIKIGTPLLDGAKVSATVKAHGRGKKIEIIKFRRRKHHMKRAGHRQDYTEVEITGIS